MNEFWDGGRVKNSLVSRPLEGRPRANTRESSTQEIKLELVLNFNARRVFSTRVLSLSLSMLAARHTFGRSATSKDEGVKHTSDQIGQTIRSQFNPPSDAEGSACLCL